MIGKGETYLGDGVYASFDGMHIWLRTEREYGINERIALDIQTYRALLNYGDALKKEIGWNT